MATIRNLEDFERVKIPVLFLDIDGVLNHEAWIQKAHTDQQARREARKNLTTEERCLEQIDPKAAELANQVCSATGCSVVISSSWRHAHSLPGLRRLLRLRGFDGEIIGFTPATVCSSVNGYRRGDEIAQWLSNHGGMDWREAFTIAIVDDNSDMGGLCDRLVQTSWKAGLTEDHVERLIALLME